MLGLVATDKSLGIAAVLTPVTATILRMLDISPLCPNSTFVPFGSQSPNCTWACETKSSVERRSLWSQDWVHLKYTVRNVVRQPALLQEGKAFLFTILPDESYKKKKTETRRKPWHRACRYHTKKRILRPKNRRCQLHSWPPLPQRAPPMIPVCAFTVLHAPKATHGRKGQEWRLPNLDVILLRLATKDPWATVQSPATGTLENREKWWIQQT